MINMAQINNSWQRIAFDGVDEQMLSTSNPTGNSNSSGSVCAWVQYDTLPAINTVGIIFGLGGDSVAGGNVGIAGTFFIDRRKSATIDNKIEIFHRPEGATFNSMQGSTTLEANTLYHVCLTADGSTWKLYLNGVEETLSAGLTGGTNTNTGDWFDDLGSVGNRRYSIGNVWRYNGWAAGNIDGFVDTVFVTDTVLTQDQVTALYNGGNTINQAQITALSPFYWVDASDTSTLFNATSGGSLPAVGATVARLEDKSGNAIHLTQGTAGSRPIRRQLTNGLSYLEFDGSDDHLVRSTSTNLLRNVAGSTVYIAGRMRTNSGTRKDLFYIDRNANNSARLVISDSRNTANKFDVGVRSLDSDSVLNANSIDDVDTNATVLTAVTKNSLAEVDFYKNKNNPAQVSGTITASNTSDTVSNRVSVGASTAGTQPANVDIYEILVFHSVHTQSEIDIVQSYLTMKWGITKVQPVNPTTVIPASEIDALWLMGESNPSSITTVHDVINGNDLTPENMENGDIVSTDYY